MKQVKEIQEELDKLSPQKIRHTKKVWRGPLRGTLLLYKWHVQRLGVSCVWVLCTNVHAVRVETCLGGTSTVNILHLGWPSKEQTLKIDLLLLV